MSGVNRVILLGRVGKDPELKTSAGGSGICGISVATSETWKDKASGERQERTEWTNVVFFNKLAEIAGKYLKKGSQVYIEGRLQTRKWTDKNGVDRYSTEVIASEMQMVGGKPEGSSSGSRPAPQKPANKAGSAQAQTDDFDDDDIPF